MAPRADFRMLNEYFLQQKLLSWFQGLKSFLTVLNPIWIKTPFLIWRFDVQKIRLSGSDFFHEKTHFCGIFSVAFYHRLVFWVGCQFSWRLVAGQTSWAFFKSSNIPNFESKWRSVHLIYYTSLYSCWWHLVLVSFISGLMWGYEVLSPYCAYS